MARCHEFPRFKIVPEFHTTRHLSASRAPVPGDVPSRQDERGPHEPLLPSVSTNLLRPHTSWARIPSNWTPIPLSSHQRTVAPTSIAVAMVGTAKLSVSRWFIANLESVTTNAPESDRFDNEQSRTLPSTIS